MSDAWRYCKVTIIIEDGERIITTKIHQATDIGMETNAVPARPLGEVVPANYDTGLLDFRMDLRALFDHEAGNIMVSETVVTAKKVKDG